MGRVREVDGSVLTHSSRRRWRRGRGGSERCCCLPWLKRGESGLGGGGDMKELACLLEGFTGMERDMSLRCGCCEGY